MIPVFACGLCVAVLLVAEWRDAAGLRAVAKLGAAASFLWAAVGWGALATDYGRLILAGLFVCAVGDALLLVSGRGLAFLAGLSAFLLGHVVYAATFLTLPQHGGWAVGAGAVLAVIAAVVLRWLWPHLESPMRGAVGAYVGAIATMVVLSLGAFGAGASPVAAVGAIAFAASDLSVARERFVTPGFVNAAWGLPLYFGAQLLIASTVR